MCDCLVALGDASAGGITRFAKNSDRPAAEAQAVEWHPARRIDGGGFRTTYLADVETGATETVGVLGSRPEWMWGFEHGVNAAGVAAGNETIYTTTDPRGAPAALTGMDLVRLALEVATTASDAVDTIVGLVERYGQGGSGHHDRDRPYWSSFLVADPASAFVVETSGRDLAIEQVGATRAISNRTTIPSFDAAHRHPKQPVDTLVDPRWNASKAVLAQAGVSAAALKEHLRSHVGGEDGWTVCMHAESAGEATTASVVADLPRDRAPIARMCLGSPCRSIYVPMVVGAAAGGPVAPSSIAGVPPADLRALEDALDAEVEGRRDDPEWNRDAWDRVRVLVSPRVR